jgi:gamma-glutamyltranspeptidase/glutathione hydrolase
MSFSARPSSTSPEFTAAAVSAPHAVAAQTGRNMLALGANAVEAVVAMGAVLCVVHPQANSLGGDGFWLIREPKGRVHYLQACGFAGAGANIKLYRGIGYDFAPPARGPLAALATPGLVDGWRCALELSAAFGGRMPLADLLSDAIGHAREGYGVSPVEARVNPRDFDALKDAPGFAGAFLVENERAKQGYVRSAARLAVILEQLAHAGLRDFYRGDVGRELAADLERIDAPITRRDIERTNARWRSPLNLEVRGASLWSAPPPTQGLTGLVLQGLFERLNAGRSDSFEHVHAIIEASKRARAITDPVTADFDHSLEDPAQFLTRAALDREGAAISMSRAASMATSEAGAQGSDSQGSAWLGAVDDKGLAVSYVQSIGSEFGSGCVLRTTGILMQDRADGFSLDADAINVLAPERQPRHSMNPALAAFDDGRVAVYGAGGGDSQAIGQIQAQILTRLRYGARVEATIDAPRFLLNRAPEDEIATLKMEDRFDPSVLSALRRAGHEIKIDDSTHSDRFSHGGLLVRWPKGRIDGAHDPRGDGAALGL